MGVRWKRAIEADLGRTRIQTLTATVRPTTNDGRTINLPESPRGFFEIAVLFYFIYKFLVLVWSGPTWHHTTGVS